MTVVKVILEKGHIVSITADGHSGYGVAGEDIVCASVSSIIQTAALGLLKIAGIGVKITRDEKNAFFKMEIPKLNDEDRHNADMILDTMLCGIADLNEGYSDFIDLEVK